MSECGFPLRDGSYLLCDMPADHDGPHGFTYLCDAPGCSLHRGHAGYHEGMPAEMVENVRTQGMMPTGEVPEDVRQAGAVFVEPGMTISAGNDGGLFITRWENYIYLSDRDLDLIQQLRAEDTNERLERGRSND